MTGHEGENNGIAATSRKTMAIPGISATRLWLTTNIPPLFFVHIERVTPDRFVILYSDRSLYNKYSVNNDISQISLIYRTFYVTTH